MKQTPKLLLKLPDPTDFVLVEDFNENFTKIDTEIAKMTDEETGVEVNFKRHADNKDNPHGVTKDQVGLGDVQNFGVATQVEAEAGILTSKYMTPERTKQAIDKQLTPLNNTVTEERQKWDAGYETSTRFSPRAKLITDWNLALENGMYMGESILNAPATGWFMGTVISHNDNYVHQKLISTSSDKQFERQRNNGVWSDWRETGENVVYDKAKLNGGAYPNPDTYLDSEFITNHVNVQNPGRSGEFWYIEQIFYSGSSGTSARSQFARTYATALSDMKVRHFYNGGWSPWSPSIQSLFTSVSNGKAAIANAITEKGITTTANAEFATMANNISAISTGKKFASGIAPLLSNINFRTFDEGSNISCYHIQISGLDFRPRVIVAAWKPTVGAKVQSTYNGAFGEESVVTAHYTRSSSPNQTNYHFKVNLSGYNGYVNNTGFLIPVGSTVQMYSPVIGSGIEWSAYE